jgi:hypothetical protein
MTDYTQINNWPTSLTDEKIGELQKTSGGCIYLVVSGKAFASVAPDGFVGCIPDTQFFFISDEVPESFRELYIAHEAYEYALEGGPDSRGNCLRALRYELSLVPRNIRKEYIPYRRNFFRRMVAFYDGNAEFSIRRDNILESLRFIETLI